MPSPAIASPERFPLFLRVIGEERARDYDSLGVKEVYTITGNKTFWAR
jgi:hypothetical protein